MVDACPYCSKLMDGTLPHHNRFPTRDHVEPDCRGGTIIVMACLRCNNDKGDIPIQGWLGRLRLRKDPRAEHVARFIAENPSLVPPVLLEEPFLPPGWGVRAKANDNALKCDGIYQNPQLDHSKHRRWLCKECGQGFKTVIGAAAHWNDCHNRKAS